MFVIWDRVERREYWAEYWAEVDRDVDEISSTSVYPLFPADSIVRPGDVILEAGVGMGRVLKHYRRRGHFIVGMDYEPGCISRLKHQDPDLRLYVGDVNALPSVADHYDVVLAFGTMSNVEDPKSGLHEFFRVLKPGGYLVASVTNDNAARRILSATEVFRRGQRRFSMVAYTPDEWRTLLLGAGFVSVALTPIVTRLPLFHYFPFLRADRNRGDLTTARDGDKGLALNAVGEWVFEMAFQRFPFTVSHGVVGIGRKPA